MTASPPPSGYLKLGRFERCSAVGVLCMGEWTDGQGNFWCCGEYQQIKKADAPSEPQVEAAQPKSDCYGDAPPIEERLLTYLKMSHAEHMQRLGVMAANQRQIIELLRDISVGLT